MEDAASYADRIAIMHEGRCVLAGTPREIFADEDRLLRLSFRTTTNCQVSTTGGKNDGQNLRKFA